MQHYNEKYTEQVHFYFNVEDFFHIFIAIIELNRTIICSAVLVIIVRVNNPVYGYQFRPNYILEEKNHLINV